MRKILLGGAFIIGGYFIIKKLMAKDIELKNATRNFLNFKNFYKGKVLKIKESKCKY